ncbi:aminoacyl--tRNA ligase-related protein [Nitrosomonas sp.]|uniref:aminoacyl--tRNA ligase-related protein n=1 Tax=Nitrosomonas sp. TaxID=42353 RepID=UPI00342F50DC
MVRDEIVPLQSLPLKYVAHTPCFRYRSRQLWPGYASGLIRQHQFSKVELVHIVTRSIL